MSTTWKIGRHLQRGAQLQRVARRRGDRLAAGSTAWQRAIEPDQRARPAPTANGAASIEAERRHQRRRQHG